MEAGEPEQARDPARPATVYDVTATVDRLAQWRRLPRLTRVALEMVWSASRSATVGTVVLQAVAGGAIALQLLAGKFVLQQLIDSGGDKLASLIPEFVLLIAATVLFGAVNALLGHQQALLTELVGQRTMLKIVDTASAVDMQSFETPSFYDQLTRARTSGAYRPIQMVNSVSTFSTSVFTSVGIGVVLLTLHPILLPLVLVAGVPLLLSTLHNSRKAYEFEYAMTPEARERAYLSELLSDRQPAKELRVFGSGRYLYERFAALTDERVRRYRAFLRLRLKVSLAAALAGAVGGAIALGSLAWLLAGDRIDVAAAVTGGVAMQLLASRLSAVTGALGKFVEAGIFLDDYHRFLDLAEHHSERRPKNRSTSSAPRGFHGLALESVSFTYPGTESVVLDEVSLDVHPGEVVALVGENGSGKTTLVKLICQLYRPDTGRVLWNGEDVSLLSPEEVREEITVIFQDFIQYHLTARENVGLGRVERLADDELVAEAARRTGADRFLLDLPAGLNTRLGRQFYGGHELSIGQWQRVALARAFFRGGGFLVLDEPTAALDAKAEQELFSHIRELATGRSVLLISHRFSSVRTADRIYVLDGGRVVERGSHDELVAQGGQYARLFELQAAAYL